MKSMSFVISAGKSYLLSMKIEGVNIKGGLENPPSVYGFGVDQD
jgi:hypothetical protein